MKHLHVIFHGRVQGVGFRYRTHTVARGFDVLGFVKNLPDGTVELQAEGRQDELNRFLDAILETMGSNIRHHEVNYSSALGRFSSFSIQY